jgi:hypothetical protein
MSPIPFALSRVACMERSETNRVSVADQGASILRQRILKNGGLFRRAQLQGVPTATSLGVSRTTVREANCILDRSQPQRSGKIDSGTQAAFEKAPMTGKVRKLEDRSQKGDLA